MIIKKNTHIRIHPLEYWVKTFYYREDTDALSWQQSSHLKCITFINIVILASQHPADEEHGMGKLHLNADRFQFSSYMQHLFKTVGHRFRLKACQIEVTNSHWDRDIEKLWSLIT